MQPAKDGHEDVEENPDAKEELAATLVDHPGVKLVCERAWLRGSRVCRYVGECALEALQPAPLGFVALEMDAIALSLQVGVLLNELIRPIAVGEVEPGDAIRHAVCGYRGRPAR